MMDKAPQPSIRQEFEDWRARMDAAAAAGAVGMDDLLALMRDLRQTLEDVAYRVQAMHEAEYLSIVESYSRRNDLILELPPCKPTAFTD